MHMFRKKEDGRSSEYSKLDEDQNSINTDVSGFDQYMSLQKQYKSKGTFTNMFWKDMADIVFGTMRCHSFAYTFSQLKVLLHIVECMGTGKRILSLQLDS